MVGLIFHLIPHTHWDREWYLPRAALQARLVAVTDDLIERLQANRRTAVFCSTGKRCWSRITCGPAATGKATCGRS